MGKKQTKLVDSFNAELKNGDSVYVSVPGYFGQICPVSNNKIDYTNALACVYPKHFEFELKKINNG